MAAPIDEFDEYLSRSDQRRARLRYVGSHENCEKGMHEMQSDMCMRASFKSDCTYHSNRKPAREQELLTQRVAEMSIHRQVRRRKIAIVDSCGEIDCDFPSPDDTALYDDVLVDTSSPPCNKYCPTTMSQVGVSAWCLRHRRLVEADFPASHHRSRSCRVRSKPPSDLQFQVTRARKRTASMPSRSKHERPHLVEESDESNYISNEEDMNEDDFYRVRTFAISAKGIINRGDSFKKKPLSAQSSLEGSKSDSPRHRIPSTNSQDSSSSVGSSTCPSVHSETHTVFVLGSGGVGKTSLIRQFLTSEYMGSSDTTADAADGSLPSVSVIIDGVQSTLEFIELADPEELTPDCAADAFVAVFALNDLESFDEAVMCLHVLRKKALLQHKAIILVANKGDIVRGREIDENEAKIMAVRYGCKYVEVSAILNLKVDELLVGILKQIRLNDKRTVKSHKKSKNTSCIISDNGCLPVELMGSLFGRHPHLFHSCDNLLTL